MASSTIFISATDARQNPIRESVVHDEARAIETAILNAVKCGLYQTTLTNGSPMTGYGTVNVAVNSVDLNSNQLYIPGHPFKTGDLVTVSSNGTLPAPLNSTAFYAVIYIDQDYIKLADSVCSANDAIPMSIDFTVGVTDINLVDNGTGYLSAPTVTVDPSPSGSSATALAYLATYGNVDTIAVISNGTGYTTVPSVSIEAQGSGAIAGAVKYLVVSVSISTSGTNYRVGDVLSVVGGTGTSATATVTSVSAGGGVVTIALGNPGLYSVIPTLSGASTTVQPGGGSGCSLNLVLGIGEILAGIGGFGYTYPPVVSINGGATIDAEATAVVTAGSVTGFLIDSPGSGYTSAPTITLDSGNGASAIAVLQPAGIGNITITNPGSLYVTAPSVSIDAVGSGADIDSVLMKITSATLSNSGGAYTVGDVLLIAGGAGTNNASIQITQVGAYGQIISYNLITSGSYSDLPILDNNSVIGGTGNSATFNLSAGIDFISLNTAGTGYQAPPVVIITPADSFGTGAAAIALLSGTGVDQILVTSAGSGYKSIPNVTITSGSGATATAILNGDQVESIEITNPGENYTYPPLVVIAGTATAYSSLEPTGIARIDVTTGGDNYVSKPIINVIPDVTQQGVPVAPSTSVSIGYSVNNIVIVDPGSGYQTTPGVTISAPAGFNGTQATADAVIGAGIGTTVLSLYHDSRDYYKVWKNQSPSNSLYTRPYTERMDTVIAYFTGLGYTINRQTNPATGNTIQWSIMW